MRFYSFDHDLDPIIFVLEHDLDIVNMYWMQTIKFLAAVHTDAHRHD